MKNNIGAEIRKRRKALNLTLEELAFAVGTDGGNLSRAERGVQGLSDDLLNKIVNALGCSIADLYLSDNQKNPVTPIGTKRIPVLSQDEFNNTSSTKSLSSSKYLACDLSISDKAFALSIDDAAMLNDFKKNDRLIIEPAMQPIPGDYVAVRSHLAHKTFIRKYRALGMNGNGELIFEAKPINDDYPTMKSDIDLLDVLGVVIEHRRGLREP